MKLKVLYILPPTRSFAGVERVIDDVCCELAERCKFLEIDVLHTSFYEAASDAPKYNKIQTTVTGRLDLMRTVRRVVRQKPYDLIVVPQVESTVLYWFSCLGLGRPFVTYLHGNPKFETRHWKAKVMFFLMKHIVLRRLAGVFGVSPSQLEAFRVLYPSAVAHHWVPNPVRRFEDVSPAPRAGDVITMVKVGRFAYQKGQDILIRAFALVRQQRRNVRLVLVGYGTQESRLRQLIAELNLQDCVSIEHHPQSPAPVLRRADIYVSSSRWEGWSLAICEALRFGLPVVATDCEFGPRDILTDPRLGRLTPSLDEASLAETMLHYCDNLEEARRHAGFRRDYVERFDAARVVHAHAEALVLAAGAGGSGLRRKTSALLRPLGGRLGAGASLARREV